MARSIRTTSLLLLALLLSQSAAAVTRHVCTFRSTLADGTRYVDGCAWSTNLSNNWTLGERLTRWLAAGTASKLTVTLTTAPGGAASRTFAFRVAGADSALSVTLGPADTTASNTSSTVAIAAGDVVMWKHTSAGGVPASTDVQIAWTFTSTNAGESSYGVHCNGNISSAFESWTAVFATYHDCWETGSNPTNVVSTPGTMTRYDIVVTTAPGAGKSHTCNWYKNGTKQDGGGASTDTTLVISESETSDSWTGSLSFAAGDTTWISCIPGASPTASGVNAISAKFVATTDGQSMFCGGPAYFVNVSNSATNYSGWRDSTVLGLNHWDATESNRTSKLGTVHGFTLNNLYVRLSAAPGAGTSYTFDLRVNSASPGGTLAVTIADTATSGSDTTGPVSLVAGDTIDLRSVPAGTPTARSVTWCSTMVGPPPDATFPALTVGVP